METGAVVVPAPCDDLEPLMSFPSERVSFGFCLPSLQGFLKL